ncbi:alpha/beta fold hydrolase [Deinococcus sp. MIMF12]|uniref:Alpha/beta fold hydrolase n=1 Tax=Deinococcus rhizophilus TaxID=3049544 RepID=A0ABT7JP74_9DEIO|nr:alpha/beta fold hydrolase [Deinococcus rhizophilus]MDL2345454.1 alpha/beta fold hydrolase [Deinococcus rhizophilus]
MHLASPLAGPTPTPARPTPTFLEVSGVRVRHVQAGTGPPVVLLHGIGRSLEDWSQTLGPLAARHAAHAPDLIGFGLSDKPDVPYTLAGLARFVRHYLEAVGLDAVGETRPVTLVGNSLGGAVAAQFALLYPGRTRALVLVGSAGFGQSVTLALRLATVPRLGEVLLRPSPLSARRTVASLFHDPRHVTPERVRWAEHLGRQPGAARAFLRVARHLGAWRGLHPEWRRTLAGGLAGRNLPTLIVWGERDRILPAAHLEEARRLHPHARVHLSPDTGHVPQVERAADFTRLVLEFLEEQA